MIQLLCAVFASVLGFSGPFFLYRIVNLVFSMDYFCFLECFLRLLQKQLLMVR